MTRPPRVSVVTATYNGVRFLRETVESVLAQTFCDFEYIIVDDASTDGTPKVLAQYARQDSRIHVVRNAANLNPAGALNRALAHASGEYVAVLDHDDLALPERLACQYAYMEAHPQVGAVGAQVRSIDAHGATMQERGGYPLEPAVARWSVLFYAPLLHSASMYRREILQQLGGYSTQHPYLCDYELLGRLAYNHTITNLPDVLVCYRSSESQLSRQKRQHQTGQMLLVQLAIHRRWLGIRQDLSAFSTLLDWMRLATPDSAAQAEASCACLDALWSTYTAKVLLSDHDLYAMRQEAAKWWALLAYSARPMLRDVSRTCLDRAIELDPEVLQRSSTRTALRRARKRRKPRSVSVSSAH